MLAGLLSGRRHDPNPIGGSRNRQLSEMLLRQSLDEQPMVSPVQGFAKLAQAYASRNLNDRAQEDDKAANQKLASLLAPEEIGVTGNIPGTAPIPGAPDLQITTPEFGDKNASRREQLAALLDAGIGREAVGAEALKSLGFGKAAEPIKLGKNDRLYAPGKYDKPLIDVAAEPVDYNKPFLADGSPNPSYQQYELDKAQRSKPTTTVTVNNADKPFAADLGKGAADIVTQSSQAARGAVDTINTANQIKQALDTGLVTAGPGATFIQAFGQITGGDPNKLVATRQTIQGLSKLTLAARSSLKGQGQVSDFEGKLLAKAASGDIDSMTVPEIRAITDVADRLARASIQQNRKNVERARAVPGSGNVVDFFDVQEPAAYAPAAKGSGRFKIERVQ